MWMTSGNLALDHDGTLWRSGWGDEHETVEAVCLGSIESRPDVEDNEEDDRKALAFEWAMAIEAREAERAERWAEWWGSR